MSNETPSLVFKDVIVAVHGIGEQSRYSTVRSVATRLAASKTLLADSEARPVAPQPLGYFHSGVKDIASISLLDDLTVVGQTPLGSTGFAEVYWADIPGEVLKEGRTLEETKAWGRTVVARAQALWMRAGRPGIARPDAARSKHKVMERAQALWTRAIRPGILPPDFSLAAEVLQDIIETVYVLENLLFLADKAGLFKFDLREVLEQYLGDVQLVAEFANYRADIVLRFHQAMESIYDQCKKANPPVRLHIVAHSEGTVVSFLGLLQAMSGKQLEWSDLPEKRVAKLVDTQQVPEWLKHVHGYMTIGSPIDKHLLLWPRMWEGLKPEFADRFLKEKGQIRWRNYYDYGDPVGFKLDTTRRWLYDVKKSHAFEFCGCSACHHDIGFARYLLPGKAHNDYWNDPDVFEHFIVDVVKPGGRKTSERPVDKFPTSMLSPVLPHVLSATVLVLGVFILVKAVSSFTDPRGDPLTEHILLTTIGVEPAPRVSRGELFMNTLGIASLIAGTTLFARLPRLAVGRRWWLAGAVAFVMGCLSYAGVVSPLSRREIGAIFAELGEHAATVGVLAVALLVGLLGSLLSARKQGEEDRRKRWIWKGTRPLMVFGAIAVVLFVVAQVFPPQSKLNVQQAALLTGTERQKDEQFAIIQEAGFTEKQLDDLFKGAPDSLEKLPSVKPILTAHPPVWPVLLATAGFLYVWWLATLLFDLSFVWHRYVRNSVANERLTEWGPQELRRSSEDQQKPEECRNPRIEPERKPYRRSSVPGQ